ncbi:MAG: glycosyltransferase, partial [Acidobacteria bacterium]|nr:glycosyltransferase [Acidobacteriota bacterium]
LGYVQAIEHVLQGATILVLPSYREGVPRVLLEAAACAVPAVAFDVPGCREAITDGETGFLVADRTGRALADSILTILLNPGLRERMGPAARERAVREFDVHAITDRTLEVYRELGLDV